MSRGCEEGLKKVLTICVSAKLGHLVKGNLRCLGVSMVSGGCIESTWEVSRGCLTTLMVSGVCLGFLRWVLRRS